MARGAAPSKDRTRRGARTSPRAGGASAPGKPRGAPRAGGGPSKHRHDAHASVGPVGVAVITVSSTRTQADDASGAELKRLFTAAGHKALFYRVVPDDVGAIQKAVRDALLTDGVDLVVTNGGTGMGPKDFTLEAVEPIFEKRADGWGDVFRAVSREEVGTGVFLSRSAAGTVGGKWLVCLPGSTGAVRTAARKLLLPEVEHMVWELRR
jgi:molybdenum cofactor biosynthesis protein B